MKIIKRIVEAPSVTNRIPSGVMVVPKYPDVEAYRERVVGGIDERTYEDICYAAQVGTPLKTFMSSLLPTEVGYVISTNSGFAYAVPKSALLKFLREHQAEYTEHGKYDIWAEIVDGHIIMHNDQPTVEGDDVVFINYINEAEMVPSRVSIDKTFRVFTDRGVKLIRPKGDALIYGLYTKNPELIPVLKGEIVDVSGNTNILS